MKVLYLNPPYGEDFVRSARWAAKSRGRVQRHPEQALIQVAVLEKAGHKCKFVEGAATNMTEEDVLDEVKKFKPDLTIVHTTTPSIYNDIEYARKRSLGLDLRIILATIPTVLSCRGVR